MEKLEKAYPEHELLIGGEVVKVVCDYQTIFNYEKSNGRPLASLFSDPNSIMSVVNAVEFLHAAIKHQNKKFTKEWILANFEPRIMKQMSGEIFPAAVNAAFVEEQEAEQEKKEPKQVEVKGKS